MRTPTEFWPILHLLYARLEAAGATHEERLEAVTASYAKLSPPARRDLLRELRSVAAALGDLEPLALVEALHDGEGLPRCGHWRDRPSKDRGGVA